MAFITVDLLQVRFLPCEEREIKKDLLLSPLENKLHQILIPSLHRPVAKFHYNTGSVTRLGYFWKVFGKMILAKVAQISIYFWANF